MLFLIADKLQDDNCAREPKTVSLSAALQRVIRDPVKGAEMRCTEKALKETHDSDLGVESFHSDSGALFRGVEHLEDQIPNVAEKIMQNIERTFRHPKTAPPRKTADRKHYHVYRYGPTIAEIKK